MWRGSFHPELPITRSVPDTSFHTHPLRQALVLGPPDTWEWEILLAPSQTPVMLMPVRLCAVSDLWCKC